MSSAAKVKRPATYEDLCRLPENMVGEILNGDLHASPRPALPHAVTASAVGNQIGPPFNDGRGGPGGWWSILEPELHLGQDVVVPDWGGWRRTRVPRIPAEPFMTLAPDWACEVLSASTERIDRIKKLAIYAREDVKHVWLVNPLQRTLEVLRLESGRWVVVGSHEGDSPVRAEPFDAIELEMERLWAASPPLQE